MGLASPTFRSCQLEPGFTGTSLSRDVRALDHMPSLIRRAAASCLRLPDAGRTNRIPGTQRRAFSVPPVPCSSSASRSVTSSRERVPPAPAARSVGARSCGLRRAAQCAHCGKHGRSHGGHSGVAPKNQASASRASARRRPLAQRQRPSGLRGTTRPRIPSRPIGSRASRGQLQRLRPAGFGPRPTAKH